MGPFTLSTYCFLAPLPCLAAAWLVFFVRGTEFKNGSAWFALIYSSGACVAGAWGITHPDTSVEPPLLGQPFATLTILFALVGICASRLWSKKIVYPESIVTLLSALIAGIAVVCITY